MTRDTSLTSINCTSCGAGLDILGGGRIVTHICPYCGSELDAQDEYRILRQFSDMPRPASPFRLGMTGKLLGVDWTVIGTLGMKETWAGKVWEWVEHQIYSPTHGYAWLVLEDGHTVFSRRHRHVSNPAHMSVQWVETSENRPTVRMGGETFRYYQTSTSRITFAEGEFTWAPKVGQESTTVSAMSGTAMLEYSQSATEREVYRSVYLAPKDVLEAFGLKKDALKQQGTHPLQTYTSGPNAKFIQTTAGIGAIVALLIAIVLTAVGGTQVLEPIGVARRALPQTINFDITDTTKLAGIHLNSDVSNSWAYFEVELTDPQDDVLFEAGRTVEYYFGRDADGSWSEGSRSAWLYFRPTHPGTYELVIDGPEAGTWGGGREPRGVAISAYQGYSSGVLPGALAFVLALIACWHIGRRMWHKSRRWSKSDWSDE